MLKKKNPKLCPNCQRGILKKQNVVSHYIDVTANKFVGADEFLVGSLVPAPDYKYTCPKCKCQCIRQDNGKYKVVKKAKVAIEE